MKKFCKIIVAAALVLAAVSTIQAQPFYGSVPQPVISTASATKGTGGTAWTNAIAVATTNVTQVSAAGNRYVGLQFDANLMATNAAEVTVIWQLARNVKGTGITNAVGTGVKFELFQTVTNVVAVNNTAAPTVNVSIDKGGIPNVFVYSCTPSAGTVTNATVYANQHN